MAEINRHSELGAVDRHKSGVDMTFGSDGRPPRWAEALLSLLLKPRDRESVSGDLLEEYRESVVPARGAAADRWYIRQVGWFLFRASWVWGAFLGGALLIRYLFDTLSPPTDYFMRATVLSYAVIGGCLLSGLMASWRTRSMFAGLLISFSGATIGAVLSIVGAAILLAIWHDPATLQAWRDSGGLGEAFIDVPLKLVAIGTVMGSSGALLGKFGAVAFGKEPPVSGSPTLS